MDIFIRAERSGDFEQIDALQGAEYQGRAVGSHLVEHALGRARDFGYGKGQDKKEADPPVTGRPLVKLARVFTVKFSPAPCL